MSEGPLKAPFPWAGGKSRAAHLMWERLGDTPNRVIPFAGSLADLLACPFEPRIETVNDIDCYLANFWRCIAWPEPVERERRRELAADAVARWADWPVNEADLHARHLWLVNQAEFRERMRTDPEHFDPKVAGWWVWGLCAWIGSGWCAAGQRGDGRPSSQLPHLGDTGRGQLPDIGASDGAAWGRGVHAKDASIYEMFDALASRLRRVRVACGDFERVLSDSVTWRHGTTAVILDPEYPDGAEMYATSAKRDESHPFYRATRWAEEHWTHPDLRIVVCGYEGTWTPPHGGETVAWKAKGGYGGQRKNGKNENAARERLWFSPACLRPDARPAQGDLFARGT